MTTMIFKLRSGHYIGDPIMFLSLGGLWPQVVQQFIALVWQVEMAMEVEI
jgi:hypothetical protein